ncbi:transcription termination/antitermination protein NusG, partial [Phaeobacter italicus]|uniref:transcription termination/antitermination protein NusG n=1 Tax=Phaeobacter italicus TaxID=481446 RepID=UPI001C9386DD
MSLPDRAVGTEMDWYAVKLKARQNGGRRETLLGVEYETYKARNGQMARRKVKGSGQRVFVPELVLQKAGFEVFLPVKREWQRISRFRPEKELRSRPAMEGWLFVGWPAGQARFHELMALDVVSGVMGAGGQPVRISDAKVRFLMRKFGGGRKRRRSSDVDQP